MELIKNKKGSIQDIVFIMVTMLAVSIIVLLVYKVSDELNTKFQDTDLLESNGKTSMQKMNNMFPGVLDNSILFLAVGIAIATIVMASLIRVHPIFMIFFIIFLVILIMLSAAFSNIYQKIASDPEFSTLADNLLFTSYIMQFLPFIIGIIGFTLAFIMYKTWQNG